jgi:putative transcriptional regulator
MIQVRLREAMRAHRERTGRRMTYNSLSAETGIAVATLQSLGSRRGYNATLATIERICRALGCTPGELLELQDDDGMITPPCR